MSKTKYAVGIDFGTESGRAVLVEVATGREVASAVYPYQHGVIDEVLPLPGKAIRLDPASLRARALRDGRGGARAEGTDGP